MFQTQAPPQLNPVNETERRKLLTDWNATETELPGATSIHELIEQRAAESPDAIALICGDLQLTYSELNARANQVAAQLCKLGVGPETLVGICIERSLEMVIGLLGILKSGGAYVPLDPTYPQERLAFMLEDSKPLVLVTQTKLLELVPKTSAHVLRLDNLDGVADFPLASDCFHASSRNTHNASALAYVIYTSGSTGKPKGVMVEHRNALNFFAAMDARIPFSPGDTWLAVTSPSFDISVLELFWTLSRGFKVVVNRGDEAAPNFSIPSLIQRHSITHLQCTPSMASMLLIDEGTRNALGQLQTLLVGGEPFPVTLARQLRQICKGTILNMYGPTETTVWSTTWQLPPDSVLARIPVGRPIANTQIYIVSPDLQPVPIGVEGELLIGGAGVARGYLGRDQLTAERFISNPFIHPSTSETQPPARLYCTGDLARYLPDGNIELLGRIDHQVKIRGHRVEPGEIETCLDEQSGVRKSVVLFRELSNGEKALVAYLIPRGSEKPTREQLREYAKGKLPEFMVPGHFVFMTAFPQTPNKKIDRNAFPLPEMARNSDYAAAEELPAAVDGREAHDGPEQPVTPVEDALAMLWKELLGLQRVGPHDNFFELGGHSMLAMQLVAKVRKRFNIDFPLKNVFERQTLAGMAEIIEAMAWSNFVKTPRAGEREVVDV